MVGWTRRDRGRWSRMAAGPTSREMGKGPRSVAPTYWMRPSGVSLLLKATLFDLADSSELDVVFDLQSSWPGLPVAPVSDERLSRCVVNVEPWHEQREPRLPVHCLDFLDSRMTWKQRGVSPMNHLWSQRGRDKQTVVRATTRCWGSTVSLLYLIFYWPNNRSNHTVQRKDGFWLSLLDFLINSRFLWSVQTMNGSSAPSNQCLHSSRVNLTSSSSLLPTS